MKKFLLPILLLLVSIASFAQDEQHSAEYNWGERNAVPVLIGVVVLIVVIIIWVRKRKKTPPGPPKP